jgi:hypothetical protein
MKRKNGEKLPDLKSMNTQKISVSPIQFQMTVKKGADTKLLGRT